MTSLNLLGKMKLSRPTKFYLKGLCSLGSNKSHLIVD